MLRRSTVALLMLASAQLQAAAPQAIPIDDVAANYIRPHERIEVEPGRWMNLHCEGEGSPTVVFDSGLSDWSNTWALIQPAVATRTRACSYDRAGMGYSDASDAPRTPFNVVADLRTLLKRAGIEDRLVLVGHSLGGFNMKLYAALHPEQVAGVVLVDPSEERLWARVGSKLVPRFGEKLVRDAEADDRAGIGQLVKHFRECAELAKDGKLDDEAYARCSDPVRIQLGPDILAERKRLQPSAAYQATQFAEVEGSMFVPNAEADAKYASLFGKAHPLGDRPLVVLTHSVWDMTPPFGETGWISWLTAHQETAKLSRRGTQRVVPMSRHNIQIDQPQAVIDAVAEVLDAVKTPAAK